MVYFLILVISWYKFGLAIENARDHDYGVATISRLLKIIGLFCRNSSLL